VGKGVEKGGRGGGSKSGGRAVANSHMKSSSLNMPRVSQYKTLVSLSLPSSSPLECQFHMWLVKGMYQHWACLKSFFDNVAIDRVVQSMLSYAEQNKNARRGDNLFK